MDDVTSERLLERARGGDRGALEALLERHQAQVYRFGMKMCRDPEDAKDVLQDTLLALARGVRDFRGASSLSTWLFTVARSFCIKKRRKPAVASGELHEAEHVVDAAPAADDALASRQIEDALEQAIRLLEPMYREVLLLRDVEGLSAKEVAEVLGIGVPAVKSRLHRARIAVRERIAPLLEAPLEPAAPGCPDILTTFSRNLEGEISADVCARMEAHVAGCEHCRATCDSLKHTLSMCRASGPKTKVPEAVQAQVRTALRATLAAEPRG
jgi:RNA polymerase sigma-70 factor (ECF subfamily)